MNKVYLKAGKERPIENFHHWIFSGAIESGFNFDNGEIAEVYSSRSKFLGHAYFSRIPRTITGRMLNFSKESVFISIKNNIQSAYELRKKCFNNDITNSYRVVNGESDLLPGLIVDKYADVLVLQIGSLGMEKIKDFLVEALIQIFSPKAIYEKSNMPSRKIEGLENFEGYLFSSLTDNKVTIKENNAVFEIDLKNSHKTGFYLDQREMRSLVGDLSAGKKVLNCFSYTGGFSVISALKGATSVTSVDISKEAIASCQRNFEINNLDLSKHEFVAKDVFNFLETANLSEFDFVILDPPAFAKKKEDFSSAMSGYKKLNRGFLKKLKPKTFFLTCSCSFNINHETFYELILQCAKETGRKVKILQTHRRALDHIVNAYHSEMDYLKSILLYIE